MSKQSKAPDVVFRRVEYDKMTKRARVLFCRESKPGADEAEYVSRDHCNELMQAFAKDVFAHLLKTQIAFEGDRAGEWVKGNNSGVKACAAAVRHFSPDETQAAYDAAISDARAEGYAKGLEDAASAYPDQYAIYGNDRTDAYARGFCGGVEAFSKNIRALKENTDE